MRPKKIYLRKNELDEQFMCESMVSCDASIGSCNIEYINLSQIWHDASEEPQQDRLMLGIDCEGASIYKWIGQDPNGWYSFVKYTGLSKWAYISDLLPKLHTISTYATTSHARQMSSAKGTYSTPKENGSIATLCMDVITI